MIVTLYVGLNKDLQIIHVISNQAMTKRDDLNLMNANVKIKISKQLRLILEHKYLSFFSFYVYTTCCLYRFVAIEILKEPTPCFQRKCLNIEKTRRS